MKRILSAITVLFGTASTIYAQAATNLQLENDGMSLGKAWEYGGYLMWLLLAISVFGVAIALYFFVVLRESRVVPPALVRDLTKSLASDDLTEARRLCEDSSSPISDIVLATLDAIRNAPKAASQLIHSVAESEGTRQADIIQGQAQYLLEIAVIAPMVGLLGTVIGMLKAFGAVATNVAAAKPTLLAGGVSQAIITTIFGLIIAIPAMVAYAYFRRRASQTISHLESTSAELIAVIGSKYPQA